MSCRPPSRGKCTRQNGLLLCPRACTSSPGTGREDRVGVVGCYRCPSATMRLIDEENAVCQLCPEGSEVCAPERLTMPAGMMVDWQNLSVGIYCPNALACRGGSMTHFVASDNSTIRREVFQNMCAPGYTGSGCWVCSDGYGRADDAALRCVKCPAPSSYSLARVMLFYASTDSWLFLSAAAGVLMATTEKKQTAVLLNQLMAFATVSNIVSSGLFQTSSYQSLQSDARMFLASASGVADFAQGSAGGAMSKDCLLSQLGLSGSLWATHLASTIIPVLLMMGLALTRNPGLSLVVGTNVFLPGFTAAFGKYLIAFRLKPEEQNGQVLMPFRLGIGLDSDLVIVPVIISLCFVVGVLGWLQAAHVKADSNGKVPNYVLYLTQSYKPECSVWEIERLVRKMLLSLTTQVLPVTYSPASQMQLVSVILLAALLLHFRYKPYKNESWNTIEVALLATGLLLSGVTTTLIANDLHWARTARTGIVLMMFVFLLVTVICGTMIVLVMLNMYWERQAARSVDSGDAERQGGKELPHDEVRAEAAEMEQ